MTPSTSPLANTTTVTVASQQQSVRSLSSSALSTPQKKKVNNPFWIGGVASMGAACVTHPLDLLKVRLQCALAHNQGACSSSLFALVRNIVQERGVISLYDGLSAALLRQGTYSTTRFAIYEKLKDTILENEKQKRSPLGGSVVLDAKPIQLTMSQSLFCSLLGGGLGGIAGNPSDIVNVRMQSGNKAGYKHAFDGIIRITREEGVNMLMKGATPNVIRAMGMTAGQLTSYDFFKELFQSTFPSHFSSNCSSLHFTSSLCAGVVATTVTAPIDIIKTRIMNSHKEEVMSTIVQHAHNANHSSGVSGHTSLHSHSHISSTPTSHHHTHHAHQSSSVLVHVKHIYEHHGVKGFFKGYLPAFIRLGPHTIVTFVLLEKLKEMVNS